MLPEPWLYKYLLRSTSVYGLKPGQLVNYRYNAITRLGLVVRTKSRPALFLSTKGNHLVSIVELEKPSGPEFERLIQELYLNSVRCSDMNCLKDYFSEESFKLFRQGKLRDIRVLDDLKQITPY